MKTRESQGWADPTNDLGSFIFPRSSIGVTARFFKVLVLKVDGKVVTVLPKAGITDNRQFAIDV
jgi:hypothetical protein